jgi:site-specific recombinase XerD
MKPTDFSYHLSKYLAKYLPGVRGLSVNTIMSYRDTFAVLICFYDSGARVQELCDIVVSDIRLESPGAVRLTGKGAKTRVAPLMPPMIALLRSQIPPAKPGA